MKLKRFDYGGCKMLYCPECGAENIENAVYCQKCGEKIKLEPEKSGISKLINLRAVIFGGITAWVLIFLSGLVSNILNLTSDTTLGLIFLSQFISSIVSGYIYGRKFLDGILSGVIVGSSLAIIFGLIYFNVYVFIGAIVLLPISGIIGGVLGVLMYRRTKV